MLSDEACLNRCGALKELVLLECKRRVAASSESNYHLVESLQQARSVHAEQRNRMLVARAAVVRPSHYEFDYLPIELVDHQWRCTFRVPVRNGRHDGAVDSGRRGVDEDVLDLRVGVKSVWSEFAPEAGLFEAAERCGDADRGVRVDGQCTHGKPARDSQ